MRINTGVELIRGERQHQIDTHGLTEDYDRRWTDSELIRAARCYLEDIIRCREKKPGRVLSLDWPWGSRSWRPSDTTEQIRQLTKAGALIAAEIDRIQNKKMPRTFSLPVSPAVEKEADEPVVQVMTVLAVSDGNSETAVDSKTQQTTTKTNRKAKNKGS